MIRPLLLVMIRPLVAYINVYLQSNFKESFLSGLKEKIVQFRSCEINIDFVKLWTLKLREK